MSRSIFAALLAAVLTFAAPPAHAFGRAGAPVPNLYAPALGQSAPAVAAREAWRGGTVAVASSSALVAEAARYVGSGKFTGLPGAWCADAVSVWLRAIGKPPLKNRMAASALAYGPRDAEPAPGDLAVIRTRRGPAGHVGVVVAAHGETIDIVSGNWNGRVARSAISRRSVTAFVKT